MWCFGSTRRLSLLQNGSRGQRAQLCWVEICLSVLLPLSQRRLWAQRTEEAGSAMALGERRPRDRDMTAKSSCIPALPGSRCPCGGQERAGKPGIQWSRACQAASYAGAVCRCASLAPTLLATSGASSPRPWFGAIRVCVVTDCSAQLEHAAPRRTCVSSFSLALLSLATFSYVIFPAPSFTAEKCQTSGHVIRPRNSSSPLPNRLRVMNPLKINAPYQQQNCCCKKRVTRSYWVWWVPLSWPFTCRAQFLTKGERFYPKWRWEHKVTVQRRLPWKREGEPSSPKTKRVFDPM